MHWAALQGLKMVGNKLLVKEEEADGWRVVDDDYGQAVGKLQAESMMSTVASLFPQLETKV
jgi:hypothetical protein